MRVVVQRVIEAACKVDGKTVSTIKKGYMLLVGFTHTDTINSVLTMAKKIVNLRIFEDEAGKMNLSIKDINGEIMSISQFTLYANPKTGNRPSFVDAMKPDLADNLYQEFNKVLEELLEKEIKTGVFGADMKLYPVCDGPVTINLEF